MTYLERVEDYINTNIGVLRDSKVAVGVSGGADSVCLLLMLSELKEKCGFMLSAINVEHGIRGKESLDDSDFVEDLCCKMDIPCFRYDVDAPALAEKNRISMEEAAREARYQAFERAKKEHDIDFIAIAHNAEDNAETVIFNLARGTSLTGLAGIRPVRDFYIRPLLCMSRAEIEDYLSMKGQSFRTDSTNLSLEYTRNKIRKDLIPTLKEINPRAVDHIREMSRDLSEAADFIENYATERLDSISKKEEDVLRIDIPLLKKEKEYLIKEIIRKALTKVSGGAKDIGRIHVNGTYQLILGATGKSINLSMGLKAEKEYDTLVIKKGNDDLKGGEICDIRLTEVPGLTKAGNITLSTSFVPNNAVKIEKKTYTKLIDYDKINGDLFLRHRRSGDILVINEAGGRISLKDYFINEKIPVSLRDKIWLVCDESQVIWVIGYRLSEAFKIRETTGRVLKLDFTEE
ncbi:MAG: tRNA lysidine(34) synthetase TilS [Bacteroidaceae bacterium]|nr:tRNA lysidine(34) synthetase TilS [Bacteroidaceae bacterium]